MTRSGWLEQLDEIARRVLEQNLLTAATGDDLVAEVRTGRVQLGDEALEIVDVELDTVPATRLWQGSVRHRLAGPTGAWSIEQQAQIATRQGGEAGCPGHFALESEPGGVEIDCRRDVGGDIANTDWTHGFTRFRLDVQMTRRERSAIDVIIHRYRQVIQCCGTSFSASSRSTSCITPRGSPSTAWR